MLFKHKDILNKMEAEECLQHTLRLEKQENSTGLVNRPCESGLIKERLKDSSLQEAQGTLICQMTKNIKSQQPSSTSSTAGSQQLNKEMTSKDKSSLPKNVIRSIKSSKILAQESTGREKDLSPYWVSSNVEQSKALLSSTGTDSVDLASSYSSKSSTSLKLSSWFTNKMSTKAQNKNLPRTSFQSYMYTRAVTWERDDISVKTKGKRKTSLKAEEKTKKKTSNLNKKVQTKELKSLKYRIRPSKRQEEILKIWMGGSRYIYNLCVEYVEKEEIKKKVNQVEFCKLFSTEKDNPFVDAGDRTLALVFKNVPKDIRCNTVRDFCSAFNTNIQERNKADKEYIEALKLAKDMELEKETTEDQGRLEAINRHLEYVKNMPKYINNRFSMKRRTKKDATEYIRLLACKSSYINSTLNIFPKFGFGDLSISKDLKQVKHDYIIRFTKPKGWHIIVPVEYTPSESSASTSVITAIDPGIRTFMTTCDTEGTIKEYGIGWSDTLGKKLNLVAYLKGKEDEHRLAKDRISYLRTKDNRRSVERKMYAMRNDMHKKISKDLLLNSDHIILPKLQSNFVIKRKNGNKNLKKQFNMASHCAFHDYISWKAKKEGKIILNLDEKYTTQTCLGCGKKNHIGSSKRYTCSECKYVGDRDVSSAFNILTKHLGCYCLRTA